jgi:hypothetical protein
VNSRASDCDVLLVVAGEAAASPALAIERRVAGIVQEDGKSRAGAMMRQRTAGSGTRSVKWHRTMRLRRLQVNTKNEVAPLRLDPDGGDFPSEEERVRQRQNLGDDTAAPCHNESPRLPINSEHTHTRP